MALIEVFSKIGKTDPAGLALKQEIREDLGISTEINIQTVARYNIKGKFEENELEEIARNLLADPIEQDYSTGNYFPAGSWEIVVSLNKDVTDNIGTATRAAIADLFGKAISDIGTVRVDRKYLISGELEEAEIKRICKDLLANEVIEKFQYVKNKTPASHFMDIPPKEEKE